MLDVRTTFFFCISWHIRKENKNMKKVDDDKKWYCEAESEMGFDPETMQTGIFWMEITSLDLKISVVVGNGMHYVL